MTELSYSQKDLLLYDPLLSNRNIVSSWIHPTRLIPHINSYSEFTTYGFSKEYKTTKDHIIEKIRQVVKYNHILRTSIKYNKQYIDQEGDIECYTHQSSIEQFEPYVLERMAHPVLWIVENDSQYLYRLDIHHCFFDGYSKSILLTQLMSSVIEPPSLQYIDWCKFEKETIPKEWFQDVSSEYTLDLPYDRLYEDVNCNYNINFTVPIITIKDNCSLLCKRFRTSVFPIVIAIISIGLHLMTKQSTIVLTGVVSNRLFEAFQASLGVFCKFVYYKIDVKSSSCFSDLLLEVVSEMHKRSTSPSYTVNEKRLSGFVVDSSSMGMNYVPRNYNPSKYNLSTYFYRSTFQLSIQANPSLFDVATVKEIITMFETISNCLSHLIDNPIQCSLDLIQNSYGFYHTLSYKSDKQTEETGLKES